LQTKQNAHGNCNLTEHWFRPTKIRMHCTVDALKTHPLRLIFLWLSFLFLLFFTFNGDPGAATKCAPGSNDAYYVPSELRRRLRSFSAIGLSPFDQDFSSDWSLISAKHITSLLSADLLQRCPHGIVSWFQVGTVQWSISRLREFLRK